MASLQPIFSYLGQLANYHKQNLEERFQKRANSFNSYRNARRKGSIFSRYGFFSLLTFEGYMARGFGFLMDVITGKRLVLLLTIIVTCWLTVFIRLSFVEVWRHSAVEDFRRDIRKNMDDMDSSLKAYRLIRPLNQDQQFHVRSPIDALPQHSSHFKKKVLVFAYKRGGGSVFAEVFNQDPNAMLWYEALDPFYVARFGVGPNVNPKKVKENSDETERELVKSERKFLSDYFRHIYFCQTIDMPLELIIHNYMLDLRASKGFRQCVSQLNNQELNKQMDDCGLQVQQVCGPTVDHAIRMQCPVVLDAGNALRDIIRQMEGDLDEYLSDQNITRTLKKRFNELLGSAVHSLPSGFESRYFPTFLKHQFCLANLERTLKPCQPQITDTCKGKTLGVAHVVRLKSEDLRFILRDFATMHLVFYVRDPRAIAHSRITVPEEGEKPTHPGDVGKKVVAEAKDVCARMLADYWEFVKLQGKYPKVSFLIAKYEDMVLYPYELALEFYNHLGMWLPESYKLYVETHMIVDKAEYLFGSGNPSGNQTLHYWRDALGKNEIREMNKHCRDVLDLFQYSH